MIAYYSCYPLGMTPPEPYDPSMALSAGIENLHVFVDRLKLIKCYDFNDL